MDMKQKTTKSLFVICVVITSILLGSCSSKPKYSFANAQQALQESQVQHRTAIPSAGVA